MSDPELRAPSGRYGIAELADRFKSKDAGASRGRDERRWAKEPNSAGARVRPRRPPATGARLFAQKLRAKGADHHDTPDVGGIREEASPVSLDCRLRSIGRRKIRWRNTAPRFFSYTWTLSRKDDPFVQACRRDRCFASGQLATIAFSVVMRRRIRRLIQVVPRGKGNPRIRKGNVPTAAPDLEFAAPRGKDGKLQQRGSRE